MEKMSGGEAIVRSLIANDVDTVFGMPGVQAYDIFDSLGRHQDKVKTISVRNEQGAGYMAMGYAKSTGKVGTYCVVPGPGVLNTAAALSSAYSAHAPVLCLTGQVPSDGIGLGLGHLHELPDQLATLRSLTKWAERINHPSQAPALIAEAFEKLSTGRIRPVALETPWDVMDSSAAVDIAAATPRARYQPDDIDSDSIADAVKLISQAKKPMIAVGCGAINAGPAVLDLAERLQAPVVSHRSGRGIVADDNVHGFNGVQGYELWPETDLLIGIGSRLELQYDRWVDFPAGMKVIRIDIDPTQFVHRRPDVGIVGDAVLALAELNRSLEHKEVSVKANPERLLTAKAKANKKIHGIQPQVSFLQAIREVMPRDGFISEESSQVGFSSIFGFPIYEPRTFVTCSYSGNLGYGFPTALGVKVANPDKAVVAITGDGGFMFCVNELATAVQFKINLVTLVFNNNCWYNVQRDQEAIFDGRNHVSDLVNPDFVKMAESFGAIGYRVSTPDALKKVLLKAFAADGPVVIEIPCDKGSESNPWPLLLPGADL
ncbi:thiamine pyrophosphate-dependent enzyme [Dasania marina]|uniref:thiamine pyrophosphate-dependent enzyme n=1 Tax=Dasania marina TaxID=471499 RepID=UPI0030D83680